MKRPLMIALSLLILAMSLPVGALASEFKLVVPLPLTGKQAKFGEIMKKSYEMAAGEINAAGGIKGSTLVLGFEDSTGKPETARAIVEKLIEGGQPVIVGEYSSSCAKAVAAVAEERKTPYLVVASADDAITQQNYRYVFRQNPVNAHYADAFVNFLGEVVKPKTMAILYETSAFGTSGADAMEMDAKKLGINVVLKEKYEAGAPDFKPILSKVKSLRPDVVYMVSYVMDASLLMKQIKELRLEAKLFAGGAAGFAIPEFTENAKDAAEYVISATLWTPQLNYPGAKEFAAKYKAAHGDYPSYHGASAYAAMFVLKQAMTGARDWSSEGIRDGLKAVDMPTAFGPVKFEDKEGYQNQNFVETLAIQVQNGAFETIWPKSQASKAPIYPVPSWRERR